MKLILLGPPGIGKGTQAKIMEKQLNISHICCGDLLRQAAKQDFGLGKEIKQFMDKGDLVPDSIVSQLILERINQPDTKTGFILDGYPRNAHQATELDNALSNRHQRIDAVFYLDASQDVIIQRLSGRRMCPGCQANFHIKNMPPKKQGICDYCGGRLYQRPDDNAETIKNRLSVYQQATHPLIEYYSNKKILRRIAANDEADVVLKKITEDLNDYIKV